MDKNTKAFQEAKHKIEKEIRGKNRAEKLFEELIEKLKEFKDKAIKNIDTKKAYYIINSIKKYYADQTD